jgi:3-hydroxyacyl-[acyl-carrier-protein] dehydratase
MERSDIEKLIPHRSPCLLLDSISELEPGQRCVALMFVDPQSPIFEGHFPDRPIFPGVLMIEAVAQTAAVMLAAAATAGAVGETLLAAVNRFKFLKPVVPGQVIRMETTKLTQIGTMAYISGTVSVAGEVVASGELSVVCSA